MKIRFLQDFANNFKEGQIVEAVDKDSDNMLVDNVALISKNVLIDVTEIVEDENTSNEDNEIFGSFEEMEEECEEGHLKGEQLAAFEYVMNNKCNIALLGDAGTGKTYLLKKIIEEWRKQKKSVMVLASTGTAAINIDGVTAHSALKIPIDIKTKYDNLRIRELEHADKLIIDEVAFFRFDTFEIIAERIIRANNQRRRYGLEDIQVVVSGDFCQLAPVITEKDRQALEIKYGCPIGRGFAFLSSSWNKMQFQYIYLSEQKRNNNELYNFYLNRLKIGDKSIIDNMNSTLMKNSKDPNAVYVCGKNKEVEEVNEKKLEELGGEEHLFYDKISGEVKESDKFAPSILRIKVGCRVMCVVNNRKAGYNNGSIGTVEAICDADDFNDDITIQVKLDSGRTVWVEKNVNEIKNYVVDEEGKLGTVVVGTVEQYPLILAYAITIHKCQGKTIDKVTVNPYCWEHGQLYVALSRTRRIEDIYLEKRVQDKYLVCDSSVQAFYNIVKKNNVIR